MAAACRCTNLTPARLPACPPTLSVSPVLPPLSSHSHFCRFRCRSVSVCLSVRLSTASPRVSVFLPTPATFLSPSASCVVVARLSVIPSNTRVIFPFLLSSPPQSDSDSDPQPVFIRPRTDVMRPGRQYTVHFTSSISL